MMRFCEVLQFGESFETAAEEQSEERSEVGNYRIRSTGSLNASAPCFDFWSRGLDG